MPASRSDEIGHVAGKLLITQHKRMAKEWKLPNIFFQSFFFFKSLFQLIVDTSSECIMLIRERMWTAQGISYIGAYRRFCSTNCPDDVRWSYFSSFLTWNTAGHRTVQSSVVWERQSSVHLTILGCLALHRKGKQISKID